MRRKNPDLCPLLINSAGYWPSTAEPAITQWQRRASLSLKEETVLKTVNFKSQNFPVWKISVFLQWKERDLAPLVKCTKLRPAATDKGDLMYQDDIMAERFLFDTCSTRGITTVFLSCGHLSITLDMRVIQCHAALHHEPVSASNHWKEAVFEPGFPQLQVQGRPFCQNSEHDRCN